MSTGLKWPLCWFWGFSKEDKYVNQKRHAQACMCESVMWVFLHACDYLTSWKEGERTAKVKWGPRPTSCDRRCTFGTVPLGLIFSILRVIRFPLGSLCFHFPLHHSSSRVLDLWIHLLIHTPILSHTHSSSGHRRRFPMVYSALLWLKVK